MLGQTILDMFARSPLLPLKKHMEQAMLCAQKLPDFFEAVFSMSWDRALVVQEQIKALENEADSIKHELRTHLPKNIFLPVSRGDLLALLSRQDAIANRTKDIAGIVLGRQLSVPQAMQSLFKAYLLSALAAVEQANRVISTVEGLLEAGFSGRAAQEAVTLIHQIDELESQADDQQVALRAHLFEVESDYSPIDMMFLYQVIFWVGRLANHAQQVGHRLDMMLAR